MESNEETINNMIDKANSDNIEEVEEGLNYICKKIKSKDFEKICLNENSNFNLYKIFTKKSNYSNQKIASFLPELLNKISVLRDENIFLCFNNCGGCLMSIIFLIVGSLPSLETKFYNFVINYLGDYDGMILEKNSSIPEYITNGKNTIAIRMATSKSLEELIEKTGSPIFMSSANHSGEPICKSLEEIENTFPKIDGIVEGNVSIGEVSTIVDCTSDTIKILRQGPITIEQINDSLK